MPMYGLWLLVVPLPAFSLSRCCLQSHLLLDLELQAGINNVLRLQLYRLLSEKRNRLSLLYMCFDNVCSRMAQSLLSEEKQQKVIARKHIFLICTFKYLHFLSLLWLFICLGSFVLLLMFFLFSQFGYVFLNSLTKTIVALLFGLESFLGCLEGLLCFYSST